MRANGHPCDRARAWISLSLDGELSQLERSLLDSHLGDCVGCRQFGVDIAAVTEGLRSAGLERLERPIALPQRRRLAFRPVEAAAAVAAMVIGLGTVAGAVELRSVLATDSGAPTAVNSDGLVNAQKRFQRRLIVLDKQPGPSGVNGKTRFPETFGF